MKKLVLLLAFTMFLFSCSEEEVITDANLMDQGVDGITDDVSIGEPLVADFSFELDTINESDDLGLSNLSSGATSYEWDFGHGNVFTDEVPDFTFLSHGIYEVTLTVRNEAGESQSVTKTINVLCVFGGGTYGVEHSDS